METRTSLMTGKDDVSGDDVRRERTGEPAPAAAEERDGGNRVVVVDVRPERRALMRRVVELALGAGTVVAQVATGSDAIAAVERHGAGVAVIEVQMPLTEGLGVVAALRLACPSLLIVVCTFHRDESTQRQARDAGADAYLVKPVNARELRIALGAEHRKPLAAAASR
ncbi:MAG: response regulator [Acidimicrobiales bacterium]